MKLPARNIVSGVLLGRSTNSILSPACFMIVIARNFTTMAHYKVITATKGKEVQLEFGLFNEIALILQDDSNRPISATMLQRPETPLPANGSDINGTLESTRFGNKFKKDKDQFGSGTAFGRSPTDQRSIVRQHSQEMALRQLALEADLGFLDKDTYETSLIFKYADNYEADASSPTKSSPTGNSEREETITTNAQPDEGYWDKRLNSDDIPF
jgi:hypothetical protein